MNIHAPHLYSEINFLFVCVSLETLDTLDSGDRFYINWGCLGMMSDIYWGGGLLSSKIRVFLGLWLSNYASLVLI